RDDIIIRMYWDGNEFPSVEAPLGSFFGQGWNEAYPYHSQPLHVASGESNALVSYFTMPFANGARIEIENQNSRDIDNFYYYVDYYEMAQLPPDLGRFHAWFNSEVTETDSTERENEWGVLGKQGINKNGERNYLIADIKGKGHFVGVNYYVNSPSPIWYGEGDAKVWVDGDKFPSEFGTGLEDYYNTSWAPVVLYQTPFANAPRADTPGSFGHNTFTRTRNLDGVPFKNYFRYDLEMLSWDGGLIDAAAVIYWYGLPGAKVIR
ncbi:MAG: DUF2961 domain-containing protein, partial [Chitinophagaceae bacterium]